MTGAIKTFGLVLTVFLVGCSSQSDTMVMVCWDSACSQIKEKYYSEASNPSVKQGSYISYYENGQIHKEGFFKNNKENGQWIYYFKTGEIQSQGMMKDGRPTGMWKEYNEDGTLLAEQNYN